MNVPTTKAWKPVLRGRQYCSPACGARCTYNDFLKKTSAAADLAHALGPGWKPKVWENLGWHFSVVHKPTGIELCPSGKNSYWVTTDTGEDLKQFHAQAATPREALQQVLVEMRHERNVIDARLVALRRFID